MGTAARSLSVLCACGCGEPVGLRRGRQLRFKHLHHVRLTVPWEQRLWRFIEPEPNTGCWLWSGSRTRGEYGHMAKHGRAHRVVYLLLRGAIPPGLQLDHLCRVRTCVNPDHLAPVTNAENSRRGAQARLTAQDVHQIRTDAAAGVLQRDIARRFALHHSHVSMIVSGRRWA
jgi:HNH endonuclease